MNQKKYRICLISLTVVAIFFVFFFYNQMKEPGDTRGALFVMEDSYEQSKNLS